MSKKDDHIELPDAPPAELHGMIQFAEAFPDEEIVAALRRQLGWAHFKAIILLSRIP